MPVIFVPIAISKVNWWLSREHRQIAQLVPKELVRQRSQIEFVTKTEQKKKRRDNKIMMMILCVHLLRLSPHPDAYKYFFLRFARSSCRVFCAPLHNITSRWIKLILFCFFLFFYIRREKREKKLRSRWYSIGIGWLNLSFSSFSGRWSAGFKLNIFQCYKVFEPNKFWSGFEPKLCVESKER